MHIFLIFAFSGSVPNFAQINSKADNNNDLEFIKGADVSALLEIEENGGVFRENGTPKDVLQIFKDHGINFIRLRIWHTPVDEYCNLEKTLLMASRVKALGLKLLLDFHYSDTWADPAHQSKPAAWEDLSFQDLKDSVYQYTYNVITALKNQNTLPDIVQIGNEIICGMLWNEGRVCDQFNTPEQWTQLAELINAGISGINESLSSGDTVKIMIHIDRSGDNSGSQWFFDHLFEQGVDFDIIGLSYYPWWHGSLNDIELNTSDLAQRYGKEIIIVETAYPWTLDWYDNIQNIVGDPDQLLPGYPASVDGQTDFLSDLISLVQNIPDNKGLGLFYWEPEWISVPPLGSAVENLTLFDFTGNLLSSISVFDSNPSAIQLPDRKSFSFNLYQNYPNPFNPVTKIQYSIPQSGNVSVKVFNILGREIEALVDEYKYTGTYELSFNANNLPGGVYFYRIVSGSYSETKKMILLK